jgi:hypothetical protein
MLSFCEIIKMGLQVITPTPLSLTSQGTTMNIVSATIATVKLGKDIQTEGLKSETDKYGMAVPQFCELISFPNKNASREFKALLAKDKTAPQNFNFLQWKTPLNSQPVNVLELPQVEKLLFRLSIKGHQPAIDLSEALIGLSLQQLFDDAFEVKTTPATRQSFLDEHWSPSRDYSMSMHPWFQQHCIERRYPAAKVHDFMTTLIFGQTAEQARQKPLVIDGMDASIGLNHQESPEGQEIIAKVKRKFCLLKTGTWEEKVARAVKAVMA